MNNRKKKFVLVIFLVIEQFVHFGRSEIDSDAEKIALSYWYSAKGFQENLTDENFHPFARLSPGAIDSLEGVVAKNPSIFRSLNSLIGSNDRKISIGAKLALSELSLIFEISQQELGLIRESANDAFESHPSRINAYHVGMLGGLGRNEDFRANAKSANQEDRIYYQDALSKSELHKKFFESSAYPVLSGSATDEQIEVRKLAYGSPHITQDSYFEWRRRVSSLTQEQIAYGLDLANSSDAGIKINIFQAVDVFGDMNKLSAELVDKIVDMAKRNVKNKNPRVREAVTRALQTAATVESKELLLSMLDDPEFDVRNGAYYGLKNMGIENPPRIKGPEAPRMR